MITRYRMSIGGVQLDSCLDEIEEFEQYKDRIVLLNIGYTAPEISRTIETAGDVDGGIITKTYRQKATVTVTFGIYIYDVADRFAVCQHIKTLASKGGTIITNDRPGQELDNCVCEQYPEIDSAKDWTAPLTMVFSAYAFPYWQEQEATVRSLTGKKTSATTYVPGNAPNAMTIVDFLVNEAYSASAVTTVVSINGKSIKLYYAFKKNNYCVIDYDSNNNLRVRVYDTPTSTKYTSILSSVADTSSDKLLAKPGANNTVSIDAAKGITATFSVRGAWL